MKLSLSALNSMGFVLMGAALSGCTTLLNMDDDTPPPPTPREVRQLSIPKDLAGNRPARVPLTPEAINAQQVLVPPAPVALMAPPVPALPVTPAPEPVKEPETRANPMLFAPYVPSVKEGSVPNKWQKQPVYDFPWIPGAEPTRVNEETVVGAGEQMLGRLYAKISFDHKPEPLTAATPTEPAPVNKEPPSSKDTKKNRKGRVTDAELNAPFPPIAPAEMKKDLPLKPRKVVCESVTCLDAARDALVDDAKLKGWEMLLNRRVSMHQSFQFARSGRVIWIELNLTAPKELSIEYSLMPEQSSLSKK
jgi:hypothetical protein